MLYIWPWMVPELPPQRFTSSRMMEASARPRPVPPYSSGIMADSQPASVMALTNASGKPFSSSILRQYSAGNSAHRARTPSRMALYSSFRYGFIAIPRCTSCCGRGSTVPPLGGQGCALTTLRVVRCWPQLFEFHFRLLGDAAGVAGPQLGLAGGDDAPAHLERLRRDQRAHAAIAEAAQARLRVGAAEGAQVEGGDQRPVHHQARIALGLGDIGEVVVDAVTVEGHGGVAEQQGRAGRDGLVPVAGGQLLAAAQLRRGRLAVDDVLFLADGQAAVLQVVVLHGDEQQRAGAAVLFLDVLDGGHLLGFGAGPQRLEEFHASASPHAVAVVRRRQEATAGRMAIDAQAGLEHRLLEEAPLPQGRQGLASGGGRLAEGGGDALEQVVAQVVLGFFGSP